MLDSAVILRDEREITCNERAHFSAFKSAGWKKTGGATLDTDKANGTGREAETTDQSMLLVQMRLPKNGDLLIGLLRVDSSGAIETI